jgi:hypothetical protein
MRHSLRGSNPPPYSHDHVFVLFIVFVLPAQLLTLVSSLFHFQHSERHAIHSARKDAITKLKQQSMQREELASLYRERSKDRKEISKELTHKNYEYKQSITELQSNYESQILHLNQHIAVTLCDYLCNEITANKITNGVIQSLQQEVKYKDDIIVKQRALVAEKDLELSAVKRASTRKMRVVKAAAM